MKFILFILLALFINFHLLGQIREWQMTDSFEDRDAFAPDSAIATLADDITLPEAVASVAQPAEPNQPNQFVFRVPAAVKSSRPISASTRAVRFEGAGFSVSFARAVFSAASACQSAAN